MNRGSSAVGLSVTQGSLARRGNWSNPQAGPSWPRIGILTGFPKYRPQLATLVERPPSGDQWLHEVKFDGYRIACLIRDGKVRLESRRNVDWTAKFPEIVAAAKRLPVESALFDELPGAASVVSAGRVARRAHVLRVRPHSISSASMRRPS